MKGSHLLIPNLLTYGTYFKINGNYYYYVYNGHGDVTQVIDQNGNIVNRYTYDEWGNIKPNGIHTGPESWNKQWKEFFRKNPKVQKEEILEYLEVQKKKYGIE